MCVAEALMLTVKNQVPGWPRTLHARPCVPLRDPRAGQGPLPRGGRGAAHIAVFISHSWRAAETGGQPPPGSRCPPPCPPHALPAGTFLFCSTFPFSTMTGEGDGFKALLADAVRFNSGVRNEPCRKNGAGSGAMLALPKPSRFLQPRCPFPVPPTSEAAELAVAAMWPFSDFPMASRFISEPAFSLPFTRQAFSSCPTFSSSLGKALFPARTAGTLPSPGTPPSHRLLGSGPGTPRHRGRAPPWSYR